MALASPTKAAPPCHPRKGVLGTACSAFDNNTLDFHTVRTYIIRVWTATEPSVPRILRRGQMSEVPGNDGPVGSVSEVGEAEAATLVRIGVNGKVLEVTKEVTVKAILAKAKEAGCIEGQVEKYVIERVSEAGQLSQETTIVVEETEAFVAVPKGPTPVA